MFILYHIVGINQTKSTSPQDCTSYKTKKEDVPCNAAFFFGNYICLGNFCFFKWGPPGMCGANPRGPPLYHLNYLTRSIIKIEF